MIPNDLECKGKKIAEFIAMSRKIADDFSDSFKPFCKTIKLNLEQEQMSNEWFENGELPPVGVECEYKSLGEWSWCRVVHHSGSASWIVTKSEDCIIRNDLCEFRPIRTDRERAIEAAMNAIKDHSMDNVERVFAKVLAASWFDAGLLIAPEDK